MTLRFRGLFHLKKKQGDLKYFTKLNVIVK